jgi:hypothetical protein
MVHQTGVQKASDVEIECNKSCFFEDEQLTEMKHNRLSMKHFSYTMTNKLLHYTILEFVRMIPSKNKCFKSYTVNIKLIIRIPH